MSAGPVGSEYPGTPVAVIMAVLFSFLMARGLLSVFKRRDGSGNTTRQRVGADVVVAIVAAYLLVTILRAIWIHR